LEVVIGNNGQLIYVNVLIVFPLSYENSTILGVIVVSALSFILLYMIDFYIVWYIYIANKITICNLLCCFPDSARLLFSLCEKRWCSDDFL